MVCGRSFGLRLVQDLASLGCSLHREQPTPAAWIIELSKAKCIIDLKNVLDTEVVSENLDPVTIGNAILGYVWLRYEREELQLYDCLCNAVSLPKIILHQSVLKRYMRY